MAKKTKKTITKRFDDPTLNGTPYSLEDVAAIEDDRGKPYPRLRRTVEFANTLKARLEERDAERYDRLLCAAITGLLARDGMQEPQDLVDQAMAVADEAQIRRIDWRDEVEERAPVKLEHIEEIEDPPET